MLPLELWNRRVVGLCNLAGFGGVLDFFTLPHFRPVILNPSTGAVVSG